MALYWLLGAVALVLMAIVLIFSIGLLPNRSLKPASAPSGQASFYPTGEPANAPPIPLEQPAPRNSLPEFPLNVGTTWVYTYSPYDPLPSDPTQIITATYTLTETVTEVKSVSAYFAAKVEVERTLVAKSAEWERDDLGGTWVFWYIIEGNKVYAEDEEARLSNFNADWSNLEFQFPLSVGAKWCPQQFNLKDPERARIEDCRAFGEQTVAESMTYETAAGKFNDCYRITESFNSGGTTRWFCNGVGVVAAKYDHGGTRFGFEQTLISYLPGPDVDYSLEGTPGPPTEDSPILPVDPVLVPDVCTTPLSALSEENRTMMDSEGAPQALVDGGMVESDSFTFDIWLACDPSLSREKFGGERFSEIDGLGILTAWRYDGSDMEGQLTEYAGFEPFVSERGGSEPVSGGSTGFGITGIQFPRDIIPDFSQQDTHLRYVIKAQTPDGALSGAALAITLKREEEGYRPVDIQVEALSAEELQVAESDTSITPPFANINPEELYTELKEVRELLVRFYAPLRSSPGWVHMVVRRENPEGNGLYGSLTEWTNEEWLQLDGRGYVVAFIHSERADDGRVLQQMIARDGETHNLTFSMTGSFAPYRFDVGADLYNSLLTMLRSGQPIDSSEATLDGRPVWAFTVGDTFQEPAEIDGMLSAGIQKRVVVDRETGELILTEMVRLTPDGDEQLVWRDTNQLVERVEAPPAEVLELLGQETGTYTPRPEEGTPAPPGFDPSQSQLTKRTIEGDDFIRPAFFYGDIYAGGYLLGRVDFGNVPDGLCDRSADGSKLAFTYQMTNNEGLVTTSSLRWLDLRDVTNVHEPAPELRVLNRVEWSPVGEQIAFSACLEDQEACGLYLYDVVTHQVRLLTGAGATGWDVVWKPDGTQIAFVSITNDDYTLFILDAASGDIVYQGIFDPDAWKPPTDAPISDWGVSIPRGYSGSRCFND